MKLRTGLLLAALVLAGCDHRQSVSQASSDGATTDSALTGELPDSNKANKSPYPRAMLVALPPSSPAPATAAPTESSTSASSSTADAAPSAPAMSSEPPDASSLAASPPPAPAANATPAANTPAPASSDANLPRLAMTTISPVVATNPPSAAEKPSEQERVVVLKTSLGAIVIELDDVAAPKTCENFRNLVTDGFYNHTTFHRVIPNFMIQGGDPNSKLSDRGLQGQGGPGYKLPAEIHLKHDEGAVAMARLPDSVNPERESNGSQFYICVANCPSLDGQYTVFGHVIKGMDIADKIASQPRDTRDNPITRIEMEASLESRAIALGEDTTAK